jgi:hypothetical protein
MNSGTVTKIVDSCRHPVTMAGEACRASSGGRARWYVGNRGDAGADRLHGSGGPAPQRSSRQRPVRDAWEGLDHPFKANTRQRIAGLPHAPSLEKSTHEPQVIEQWFLGLIEPCPPEQGPIACTDQIGFIGHRGGPINRQRLAIAILIAEDHPGDDRIQRRWRLMRRSGPGWCLALARLRWVSRRWPHVFNPLADKPRGVQARMKPSWDTRRHTQSAASHDPQASDRSQRLQLWPRRHAKHQHLSQCPDPIRQPSRHRWGARPPLPEPVPLVGSGSGRG